MLLRESLIFTVVYLRLVSARLEYLNLKPRCYFETISCPCERYGTPEKSVNVTLKVCNRLNLNEHKKSVCSGKAIVEKCRGAYLIQGRERRNADSQSFHCVNGTVKFLTSPSPPNAHVGPPQVTINGRSRNLKEGGHAEFKCTFVSTLPFTVTWLFNGRPLRNDSRYSYFDCKAGLQVKLLMSTDQGNYTCVATNALGQSSNASSRLSIIKKDKGLQDDRESNFSVLPFYPIDELKTVLPFHPTDELKTVPPDRGDELETGGLSMALIFLIALAPICVIVVVLIVFCCVAKQSRRLSSTTRTNRRTKGKTEEDNEKLLGATTGDKVRHQVSYMVNASAVKNGSETDVVYIAKQREKHLQEWKDHDHEGNLKEKSTERSLGNEASVETGSFPLCFPKEVTPSKPQDSPRAALKSEGAIFIANPLELPIIQGTKDNEKLLGATTGDRVSCRINASAVKNGSETDVVYTAKQREKHLQEWEDHDHEGNLKEKSTERSPGSEASVETGSFPLCFPKEVTPSKPQDSPRAALKSEGEIFIANPLELPITQGTKATSVKDKSLWKNSNTFSTIITSEGGTVRGADVKLMCPQGAVDDPVTVKVTLEDPSKYYGLIVRRDLENDVMFGSPIIKLQPNGHVFKKPVTLTAKLQIENFHSSDVLILHGTEARDGNITWQDITDKSKIDEKNAEVIVEIGHFSVITALKRLQKIINIRTKDIVYRLNVLRFHYTMSVLVNKNSLCEELAVLFVSQDVYNEPFYREHETSALMKLKAEGFIELHVRSLDGEGEKRVYNGESLKVSVCLREDYRLADRTQGIFDFIVHSSVWWNTGEVFRLPLESTEDVRILCCTISVQGEYGHRSERNVCEIDLLGYVRNLLGVKRATFNLLPIAHLLKMPQELINLVTKSWKEDDDQLGMILQHWLKENDVVEGIATLRKDLEKFKPEDYKVTQRGQMHIRHLRELATKISSLQYENTDLMKYFCNQIQALCKAVLMDCCVELEDSAEGIQRAALSRDHVCFLENHRPVPKHIARKYQQVCLSSEECISKIFLSIVPHLIQNIKEIFVHEGISEVQNGLRGLCEEKLEQFLSKVRDAEQNIDRIQLVCIACEFLGQLCQENCGNQPPAEIEKWVERLEMFTMLNFLKPFFQHCPQDIRLYKRLEAFSLRLLKIMSHQLEIADEVFTRDFSDVSLSLIRFAKFSPSKLVRFELTNSTNSPVSIDRESNNINNNNNENVQYDRHHETFYQWFEIRKESEDELQLHASALVHIDGRICRKGAFQSTIFLKASAEEVFNACMVEVTDVAADKAKDEDSSNVRVVLCSTLKEKVIGALHALKQRLSEDVVDFTPSEVTQCHLTIRSVTSEAKKVVRLRLLYKWGSEAIGLDSKAFACFANSSGNVACIPAVEFVGFGNSLAPVDGVPLVATNRAVDLATFDQLRREGRIHCENTDLGDQLTPDHAAPSLVTPTVTSTDLATIDQLQRHGRIVCGKIEYHLHQHVNHMKGNVNVVGDNTELAAPALNDQMLNQCALPEGPSCAPHRSITDGKRSQQSPLTPPGNGK